VKKKNGSSLFGGDWLASIGASFISIIIGLIFGFLFLIVLSLINSSGEGFDSVITNAWKYGFKQILMGGFYLPPISLGQQIAATAPLILTGLSVGFAFKTGLFNIGAAGQYTLGAFGALFCAIVLRLPWWACLIGATIFGAFWGAIPGIFKAYLNIHEVITSIMFNWIGLYAVNTIMYGGGAGVMYDSSKTKVWDLRSLFPAAVIPNLGLAAFFKNRSTTIAIFLAIIIAIIIYIIIDKTTFGYELKACGYNKNAARYAGINEKKNIVLSMVIAGALAGFGAGLYYLSGIAEWRPMDSTALPAIGFNGIAVALLASSNPIGTIFTALFISHITTGGSLMNSQYFPPEIADIISGIIIYLSAFSLLFKQMLMKRSFQRHAAELIDGTGEEPPPKDGSVPKTDTPESGKALGKGDDH
jgi:simple sugar transport system permease protein